MKTTILLITVLALAHAAPKTTKFQSRNNFKQLAPTKFKPSPRVVGGNLANPHSIPYQAFLEFFALQTGKYCGGILISQNYVISTEWCGEDALEVFVTLGAHLLYNSEDTQVNVYSTEILTNYQANLALIKLPEPVTPTDAIQPATLPSRADANKDYGGSIGRMSGWGTDSDRTSKPFDVLRYVDVRITSCSGSRVCTSGEYQDSIVGSCHADDGGPLSVDGVVIAVLVLDYGYCLPGETQHHVRLGSYLDWIEENSDLVIS